MSKLELGIVFRDADNKLILMRPRAKTAGEISDGDEIYADLPSHQAEIVDVVNDANGGTRLRSHFCQSFYKDDQKTEAPAYQVIKFIMTGDEKREEWLAYLEEEIAKPFTDKGMDF